MENQGVKRASTKSAVTLDSITRSMFQKDKTMTAMLRQTVNTVSEYPSARVANDKQDNLFGIAEFGFTSQSFDSVENRVAFIDIPEGVTAEIVKAKLAAAPQSCIYKALSNKPILTSDQQSSLDRGITASLDVFANAQVVRYPANHANAGQIILDNNGKVQYRATFFSQTAKADEDFRTADVSDVYVSEAINAELAGTVASTVVANQSL